MTVPIIDIENIGKRYRLGANKEPYLSLRDEIAKRVSRLSIKKRALTEPNRNFWALKDVSFSVREGEAIGIIGRNGAGKSTLLKILSQITPPTEGKITMRGRVASLLEVGTGFHPELTGRENIYLNGTILGMSRKEVKRRFDEIVAFAEVEKFLDTPVKRYSSGMYVRLAFAVAAHLEPEILVVDEVLAVGDANFQEKCLGKMGEVAKGGRTVIFVSHNMSAITQLCDRAILLNGGSKVMDAESSTVISAYLGTTGLKRNYVRNKNEKNTQAFITSACIVNPEDGRINYNDGIEIDAKCIASDEIKVSFEVIIRDKAFRPIIFLPSGLRFGKEFKLLPGIEEKLSCRIPNLPLAEGSYSVDLILGLDGRIALDLQEGALKFEVISSDPCGIKKPFIQANQGCIHLEAEFASSNSHTIQS